MFIGFLLSFWLELTGVPLHQWLGVAIGVGAGYHLLTHWAWVKSVTHRFFKQTSSQARLYYVIDAAVMIGLAAIIVTGLVISTWLNLSLANSSAWKTIHVIASISTLLLVVVKTGLHWRWVISTARRYIFTTAVPTRRSQPVSPVPASDGLGRREFLRLMGGVSAVAVIAACSALDALVQTAAPASSTGTGSTQGDVTGAQNGTTSTQQQTATTCAVRCPKGCSYPGHCQQYTDGDNNGRCDLGECA